MILLLFPMASYTHYTHSVWGGRGGAGYKITCTMCFVHTAIMCSGVVKFLLLTFICILIIDGGICHEEGTSSEWKRQSNGSESTTASEYMYTTCCKS